MNEHGAISARFLYAIAAAAILAWGITGFFDRRDLGRSGYFFGPDRIVVRVTEGGSADAAGIEVGDRVISVNGRAAEELPMQSRWHQPKAGETHTLVVERAGDRITTRITYQPSDGNPVTQFAMTLIVGLFFLGFGFWSLVSVQTPFGRIVSYLCLALAIGLFQGPHLGPWDGISSGVEFAAAVLGLGLMAHFLLLFPKPKRAGLNPTIRKTFWIVYFLFVTLLVVEVLLHPLLYNIYGVVTTILVLGAILISLAGAGHSLFRFRGKALTDSGMSLVSLGLAIALGPPLIQMLGGLIVPGFSLPGSNGFQLLLAAIPAGFALGVRKHARMKAPLV